MPFELKLRSNLSYLKLHQPSWYKRVVFYTLFLKLFFIVRDVCCALIIFRLKGNLNLYFLSLTEIIVSIIKMKELIF